MAYSAPIFYGYVVLSISLILLIASLVVQAVALIHCITQRGDGFQAIGTLPKGAWVAILVICMLLTWFTKSAYNIFALVGIGAALIYLLDVRQGLKDLSDGKGFW
jgi:choline-glycine betaine transporter